MKRTVLILAALLLGASAAVAAEAPWATLDTLTGTASCGIIPPGASSPAEWSPATPGMALIEPHVFRTGAGSQAVIRFTEGGLTVTVGENATIGMGDLLLKARLEKMRGKVPQPAPGAAQTPLAVTPLTGVRGTDESGSKAEDPNRQHHWEENGAK